MATTEELHNRIEHDFTNHAPSPEAVDAIERLRESFKATAHAVIDLTPQSREQSLALTSIETGLMQAVAAVARNQ